MDNCDLDLNVAFPRCHVALEPWPFRVALGINVARSSVEKEHRGAAISRAMKVVSPACLEQRHVAYLYFEKIDVAPLDELAECLVILSAEGVQEFLAEACWHGLQATVS